MQIQTRAQIIIQADVERVFDVSIHCQNLPQFFTGYRAIPGIVRAETLDGLPLHEGSHRLVHNSDGSSVEEVINRLERPHIQQYRLMKGLKPPFSWLVRWADGTWLYEEMEAGTQVTWQFQFEIPHILAYSIFHVFIKSAFQTAQEMCLENMKRFLEKELQP